MVADVIRLESRLKNKSQLPDPTPGIAGVLTLCALNGLFLIDAAWHIWAVASGSAEFTLVSKLLLGLTLAVLLRHQLKRQLPINVLVAILFCMIGDVLLEPLDLNYADMSGDRPVHFVLGVLCFCIAYAHLARYYLTLVPHCLSLIKAQPWPLVTNLVITLAVLIWMTVSNQAPAYLLVVLWVYSPVVVGAATLAVYTQSRLDLLPFLALVVGSNMIVFSDTIIGLTVFTKISMPLLSNPVWILSTYALGIFLVFNAIIQIEKRSFPATR